MYIVFFYMKHAFRYSIVAIALSNNYSKSLFDSKNSIAGTIDMVYKNTDGTLSIYDWKRCKAIKKTNNFGERVIIIGDSFVEAIQVKNEDTVQGILVKKYNGKHSFNAIGVRGASLSQYLEFAKFAKEKIDFALLCHTGS